MISLTLIIDSIRECFKTRERFSYSFFCSFLGQFHFLQLRNIDFIAFLSWTLPRLKLNISALNIIWLPPLHQLLLKSIPPVFWLESGSLLWVVHSLAWVDYCLKRILLVLNYFSLICPHSIGQKLLSFLEFNCFVELLRIVCWKAQIKQAYLIDGSLPT